MFLGRTGFYDVLMTSLMFTGITGFYDVLMTSLMFTGITGLVWCTPGRTIRKNLT